MFEKRSQGNGADGIDAKVELLSSDERRVFDWLGLFVHDPGTIRTEALASMADVEQPRAMQIVERLEALDLLKRCDSECSRVVVSKEVSEFARRAWPRNGDPEEYEATGESSASRPALSKPVILIVDDDQTTREIVEEALREAGYDTVSCATPETAQALLRERSVRAAIVDGDLGDRNYEASGASARVIAALGKEIPYARFTLSPRRIPADLRGGVCSSDHREIFTWLERAVPLQ